MRYYVKTIRYISIQLLHDDNFKKQGQSCLVKRYCFIRIKRIKTENKLLYCQSIGWL